MFSSPVLVTVIEYSITSSMWYAELFAVFSTVKFNDPSETPEPVTSGPTPEKWGILIHRTLFTVSL
jgi:hypothetical protein